MELNPQRDQHFLIDITIVKAMVQALEISAKDRILEIGAGEGVITKELAAQKCKVIAVEIDEKFADELKKIEGDVEVILQDISYFLDNCDTFNKVIGNIPFQISEPLMHYLCSARNVERAVLIVPSTFVARVQKHPIFSAFLQFEIIQDVPKEAFNPIPAVKSVIVRIVKNTDENDDLFIRRKLYLQRERKFKNCLRDTLIDVYRKNFSSELTKRKADFIIKQWDLDEEILDRLTSIIPLEYYEKIVKLVEKIDWKIVAVE